MSYSLVTILFVVSFMSTVPNASPTAYLKTESQYTKIHQFVAKKAEFNDDCTNLKERTLDGLATQIQASDSTAFPDEEALQKIKDTIAALFISPTVPTPEEKIKILTVIAQGMFQGKQCRTRQPTTDSDAVLSLRATFIVKVEAVVSPGTWPDKCVKSACLVVDSLTKFGTTFSDEDVEGFEDEASMEIESAVSTASVPTHVIGSSEYIPSVDLITSTYKSISPTGAVNTYIGAAGAEDFAKWCHVLCDVGVELYYKFNPPFRSGDEEKIKDYILYTYAFAEDCVMPVNADYPSISQEISGQGKTVPANVKWRVQAKVSDMFNNAAALQGDEPLKSLIAASKFALADDSCGAKAALLNDGNNEGLRKLAYPIVQASCESGDCGTKAIQYNCKIYRRLLDINTAISTAITRRATLRTEIRAALVKMTPSVAAVGGAVSLDDLVKAVKHVAADPTISGWIAGNTAKYACVVRNLEAELITPTQPVVEPSGGGGSTEENKAPPATPATTAATTPNDSAAPPGLSGGVIAGIVVLVIILVVLLAFAVYWFIIRDKS